MDQTGYLVAPKPCEFTEDGKWIKLKVRGGELIYPRPDNLVTLNKTKFEKDENVCVAYNTTSPIYKLNALINLMRAKPSLGMRYFEKESILVSDCYALEDGVIHYTEDESGYMHVTIGSREYQYNPLAMYYFPDGSDVKKFDRICSGVVYMPHVVSQLTDINDVYLIFRKQLYTLTDSDFIKTGVTSLSGTQEEIIEMLFVGLTSVKYDPKTRAVEEIEYNGAQNSVTGGKSFYTALSFGFGSRIIDRAIKGDINLSGDVIIECCPNLHKKKLNTNMNYLKIYDDFINSRRNRELEKGVYYEKHHIIPVGLGGSNEPDNLIYLTTREHLFAHVVLTQIYPDNNSVKYAITAMCGFLDVGERNLDLKFLKTISTRFISKLREEALHLEVTEETRLKQRLSKLGEKNPMFGKKHKESSKQLMSKKTSGENHWMYGKHWTPEYRENMERIKEQRGYSPRIFSEEHKRHISESRKGKFIGENNSFFGKTHTIEMKKHLSELALNRPKKKVIDKDGDILSITECKMKYGVTDSTVRYWANRSHNNKIYWYNNGEKI